MINNKDLGIITYSIYPDMLGSSQMELIRDCSIHNPYNQYVIFTSYSQIINTTKSPILHLSHSKFFEGNLLVFDLDSLKLAQQCIKKSLVYFYSSNIPWAKNIRNYQYWHGLFLDDNTKIIAASQEIFDIYSIAWKKPICIKEQITYESFKDII